MSSESNLIWSDRLTDRELELLICRSVAHGAMIPQNIQKRWARSYISDAGYFYKRDCQYYNVCMSFDIETTRDPATDASFMYIWMLGINGVCIAGTEWGELLELLERIKAIINPAENGRCIVWVHNLSYEWSFTKRYWSYNDDYFFTGDREPIYFTHDNFFQFRDSFAMTRSSLAKLAKDYCVTQKAVGDLDYDKPRNKQDAREMTRTEYGYCINDVVILTEYAAYFWAEYIRRHYCPVTGSSVLRGEIREGMSGADYEHVRYAFPDTAELYSYLMSDIYRGGYVHANANYGGETLIDSKMCGVDFTSSYPAWMLEKYFPDKFMPISASTWDELMELAKTRCVIATCEFLNIRNKLAHSIESVSKCLNEDEILKDTLHSIIDNGRILRARRAVVALCELDMLNYNLFYTWDAVRISNVFVAERVKMPPYVVHPMLKYYAAKNKLKLAGLPYAVEKSKVNTFYGVLCTKAVMLQTELKSDGSTEQVPDFDFEKFRRKAFLLPQLGVYVSAWARHMLLNMVATLEHAGYPVIYCDTDSIKAINWDARADKIIQRYNASNRKAAVKALEYYHMPPDGIVYDVDGESIGDFDFEYRNIEAFKTLGAKRYALTYKGKFKSTVAGLPKGAMLDFWRFKGDQMHAATPYDLFVDGMCVPDCKLAAHYHDEPCEAVINGQRMCELSNVCLAPAGFTLGLKGEFENVLTWMEYNYNKETRR